MAYQFRNASTTYALGSTIPGGSYIGGWKIEAPNWSPRLTLSERLQQAGAVVSSDKEQGVRSIPIRFDASSNGQTADSYVRGALNDLLSFFRPTNAPFYLEDTTNAIRCKIELNGMSLKADAETLYRMMANNSLDVKMVSGYWEDLTANTQTSATGGIADGGTLTVNNTGDFECYPILTITALTDITLFSLTNTTTGYGFEFEDLNFTGDADIVFDTASGAITLSGVERSASIISGGPFYLEPGNNVLTYESDDGGITLAVEWRRRYAY